MLSAASSSAIIGNLNQGDYTTVSFQISARIANATAAGANFQGQRGQQGQQAPQQNAFNFTNRTRSTGNNLLVQIDYTDTTGQRQTVQKSVPIQFRAGTTGTGVTGTTTGGRGSQQSQGKYFYNSSFWIILVVVPIARIYVCQQKIQRKNFYVFRGEKAKK